MASFYMAILRSWSIMVLVSNLHQKPSNTNEINRPQNPVHHKTCNHHSHVAELRSGGAQLPSMGHGARGLAFATGGQGGFGCGSVANLPRTAKMNPQSD